MNFKQFFIERSGARHLSATAIHSGGLNKTSGSMSLVADRIKKEQRKNQKIKRAKKNKGIKVAEIYQKTNQALMKILMLTP